MAKTFKSNKKIEIILLKKKSLKSMILEKKMYKFFFAKIKKMEKNLETKLQKKTWKIFKYCSQLNSIYIMLKFELN